MAAFTLGLMLFPPLRAFAMAVALTIGAEVLVLGLVCTLDHRLVAERVADLVSAVWQAGALAR